MSKSKYNTQTPDKLIDRFGADTLRMYEMFLGPLEQYKPWDTKGINGVHNFLKKFWKLIHNNKNEFIVSDLDPTNEEYKIIHACIKKVSEDLSRFTFNTAVSAFMICINELTNLKCNKRKIITPFIILLSPYAPYIAEEIWQKLGNNNSIYSAKWPDFEKKYLEEKNYTYPVSFNGRMRFKLDLSLDLSKDEIEKIVLSNPKTQSYLLENKIKRIIIIPKKIINIVF